MKRKKNYLQPAMKMTELQHKQVMQTGSKILIRTTGRRESFNETINYGVDNNEINQTTKLWEWN
jgi:hypothetical protein